MTVDNSVTALYETSVRHVRTEQVANAFTYGGYTWLVDLDDLPRIPLLARFAARDHAGDPARSLRENTDAFLAENGIDLAGGRILMLAQARVLGYVFNPLSVFWCHGPDGALVCVVAEVHNTYGGRHRYLVRTDERGRAGTAKEFYVSPFIPVEGDYRLSLPEPGDTLDLTVTLHRDGAPPFVAHLTGRRRPATTGTLLRLALRHPVAPAVAALRIRVQGIRLWRRGLSVLPREPAAPVEGTS